MRRHPVFGLIVVLAVAVLLGACADGGLGGEVAAGNGDDNDVTDVTDLTDLTDLTDFGDFTDLSDFTDFSIPDLTDFDFDDLTDLSDFFSDLTDLSDFFSDFGDFTDFTDGEAVPIDELEPTRIPSDTPSSLQSLADDCFDGDMDACDELFFRADIDSDVEDWADRCGGRFDRSRGLCTTAVDEG